MSDIHLVGVNAAIATNRRLKAIYNAILGSGEVPTGRILRAFRRARSQLLGTTSRTTRLLILAEYRDEVLAAIAIGNERAQQLGNEQAEKVASAIGIPLAASPLIGPVQAIVGELDKQIALFAGGQFTDEMLLGGKKRLGFFSPVAVQLLGAASFTEVANRQFETRIYPSIDPEQWVRQAVAAIDDKTTQCCLHVHGQTVGLSERFETLYPPAFAPSQRRPPFHQRCRTCQALVPKEDANDQITSDMQAAAAMELRLRLSDHYSVPRYIGAFTRIR